MKRMIIKNKFFRRVSLSVLALCLSTLMSACVTTNEDGATTEEVVTPAHEKAEIYANLATGYMKKEQYEIAKRELERALTIAPNHSKSNYIMGLLLIDIEEYAEVERFMARAVQSDPQNSAAAHDLGTFLCQTGKELRSVVYLNPRLEPALLNLAKIKYDDESYLSARAYIERYFAITKPQPAPLLLGYQIELKLNANDVADDYRTQILEQFPSSKEAKGLRNKS